MRSHSERFAQTVRRSHTAVSRVDVIQDGKTVARLKAHAGEARADRLAAQMRSMEVEISDKDLTPEDMNSLLVPGTRIQLWRGVRLEDVDILTQTCTTASPTSWEVNAGGVLSSVTVDAEGALTLGGAG